MTQPTVTRTVTCKAGSVRSARPLALFAFVASCASQPNAGDTDASPSDTGAESLDDGDVTEGNEDDAGVDGAGDEGGPDADSPDMGEPQRPPLDVNPDLIDDAMGIPVPDQPGSYASDGGGYYGRNGPVMLFLTLLAHDDPTREDSGGNSVAERARDHIRAAITPGLHPLLTGGHRSWFDLQVPMALGVARHTPEIWDELEDAEREVATVLMRHALHAANLFCNTNSELGDKSNVFVDMAVTESGSLPNQSASFHAFAIGAYLYFGGTEGMNAELSAYDSASFHALLLEWDLLDIAALYENPDLVDLLDGIAVSDRAQPDPLGVQKPFLQLNTLSLEASEPGEEHPYGGAEPIATTPDNVFRRWGHDFAVGAMPRGNVGPSLDNSCGGIDFGLSSGEMPFEGTPGAGMPYELNARSSTSGPHTRSSWDYSSWAMQQYVYMFGTLAITGYLSDVEDDELWARADRAVTIFRTVGEQKWISSVGPAPEVCTDEHGDAYVLFPGLHWAQGLMDATLFDESWDPPPEPLVP